VQLVDEEDDLALGLDDLLEGGLEPLLELAAELRARDHAGQVERDEAGAVQRLRDVAGVDAQGQALGDRGLADAGLADQDGVVLAPAGEDLDGLLDLGRAAHHGVDAAVLGVSRQVTAEGVQGRGLRGVLRGRLAGGHRGGALLAQDRAAPAVREDHPHGARPLAAGGARGKSRSGEGVRCLVHVGLQKSQCAPLRLAGSCYVNRIGCVSPITPPGRAIAIRVPPGTRGPSDWIGSGLFT
jgi:hypothetical protein